MFDSASHRKTRAAKMHPSLDASQAGQSVHGINEMRAVLLTSRADGVDVAQLLREIGEASAQESSVELFRLCLGAQRVLQQVLSGAPA